MALAAVVTIVVVLATRADAHGYLTVPPSRQSVLTSNNPWYNGLNCGGWWTQWEQNQGRCGVCGDRFDAPQPRDNEAGGTYAPVDRPITQSYQEGQIIDIEIAVTAPHGGYSEFRICPNNNKRTPATQECLNRYLLATPSGETRLLHHKYSGPLRTTLVLPRGLKCTQCMLQWKWVTNTNNNCNYVTGEYCNCIGCGRQEQFYGCADVSINPSIGAFPVSTSHTQDVTSPTMTQIQVSEYIAIDVGNQNGCGPTALGIHIYGVEEGSTICQRQCKIGHCPILLCSKGCRK